MPVSKMARIKDVVNLTFETIGSSNGTRMPKTTENLAPVAWEYWLSAHLLALAQGRADKARTHAVTAGVIFDHKASPKPPGFSGRIFNGEQVYVMLNVNNGSTRVDTKALIAFLTTKGVSQVLLNEALIVATKETTPAHNFKVYLQED